MITYDRNIINKFANQLYRKATLTVVFWTMSGIFAGLVAAQLALHYARELLTYQGHWISLLFFAIGGFIIGQRRAFQYRLQAQLALCQSRIEENTRETVMEVRAYGSQLSSAGITAQPHAVAPESLDNDSENDGSS